jgi:hypothetical protein
LKKITILKEEIPKEKVTFPMGLEKHGIVNDVGKSLPPSNGKLATACNICSVAA